MQNILIMYSNEPPTSGHTERLRALPGNPTVHIATSEAEAIEHAETADIFLGHRYLRQCLPRAPRLKWVQSTAAGIQHLASDALFQAQPLLTRCPIFAEQIALHALCLMTACLRRLPDAIGHQPTDGWTVPENLPPFPRTAMVLGFGQIGQAIARLIRPMVNTIIAAAPAMPKTSEPQLFDVYVDSDNWQQQLPNTDVLFIAVPLTRDTRGIICRRTFEALPTHAVLVDMSRPGVTQMPDLVTALETGELAGAGMDIRHPETPDTPHPNWVAPNLIITPKMSVFTNNRQQILENFIERQTELFLSRQTPLHSINLEKLYTTTFQ